MALFGSLDASSMPPGMPHGLSAHLAGTVCNLLRMSRPQFSLHTKGIFPHCQERDRAAAISSRKPADSAD